MFIYTFFYKYKYTNVFLKYKDKYGHIVYQTRNTNFLGDIWHSQNTTIIL